MTTITITPTTLSAMLKALPGDTIALEGTFPTRWGTSKLPANLTFDLSKAVVVDLEFANLVGARFYGGLLTPSGGVPGLSVAGGSDIGFEGIRANGQAGQGYGIALSKVAMATVNKCVFDSVRGGVKTQSIDQLTVKGSEFKRIGADGVFLSAATDTAILDNLFHGFEPTPGSHPDAVQFNWETATNPRCRTALIQGNTVKGLCQGFFGQCGEITVQDNQIRGGFANGISITKSDVVNLLDNDLRTFAWAEASQCRIDVRLSTNVTDKGNSVAAYGHVLASRT